MLLSYFPSTLYFRFFSFTECPKVFLSMFSDRSKTFFCLCGYFISGNYFYSSVLSLYNSKNIFLLKVEFWSSYGGFEIFGFTPPIKLKFMILVWTFSLAFSDRKLLDWFFVLWSCSLLFFLPKISSYFFSFFKFFMSIPMLEFFFSN